MKKMKNDPEMLEGYDFRGGVRGKYAKLSIAYNLLMDPFQDGPGQPAYLFFSGQSRFPKKPGGLA